MGDKPADKKKSIKGQSPAIPKAHQDWKLPPHYEVRQLIGTGSYGSVCEAYDKKSDRIVAIKKVNRVFEDLIDCKRILREIAILSSLDNDRIVKVFDICIPDDYLHFDEIYLVLEICDSDFKKLFRTPVFLTELHVITLLYNTMLGLKYLHSAGIYHRDLKPANCLVNQDCSVKICDFGLSRAVAITSQPHLQGLPSTPRGSKAEGDGANGENGGTDQPVIVPHTQNLKRQLTGHVVTRWYRAPELILLQENYTEQIDVWSMGCIFAELLGMMKENIPYPSDRGPLFPGSSCFPLSPDRKHATDYKYHTRGNRDQLNMIFNVIGTPPKDSMDKLEKEDAKRYIKCFAQREPTSLTSIERFKGASPAAIDALARMLVFDPVERITVDELLAHDIFKDIRKPGDLLVAKDSLFLDFELEPELDEPRLRKFFLIEAKKFHADIKIPSRLMNI
eukprot:GEMP01009585.1.p1 GENE.GEMP01009585.1~~GEMP01009585.1.p1  ORF type:complete len:449 (-),score=114.64 GEMP01009585.1:1897-3243(-)